MSASQLEAEFGSAVTNIVERVTEPDKSLPRPVRMTESIERLRGEPTTAVLMVAAADKLDNVRSIRDTIAERGETRT